MELHRKVELLIVIITGLCAIIVFLTDWPTTLVEYWMKDKITEIDNKYDELGKKFERLKGNLEGQLPTIDRSMNTLNELDKEFAELKGNLVEQLPAINRLIERSNDKLNAVEKNVVELRGNLNGQLPAINRSIEKLEKDISELRTMVASVSVTSPEVEKLDKDFLGWHPVAADAEKSEKDFLELYGFASRLNTLDTQTQEFISTTLDSREETLWGLQKLIPLFDEVYYAHARNRPELTKQLSGRWTAVYTSYQEKLRGLEERG